MRNRIEGMNQENVKQGNRSAIIKYLLSNGATSRKDIAEAIGLTPAAVTLICTDLIEEGIIEEKGEAVQERKAGRKKILVDINYLYRRVLCIAIEVDETYITVTDLAGEVYAQKTIPTAFEEAEDFLSLVATESKELLWANGISKDLLLAAGVTVPGVVDHNRGISVRALNLWNKSVNVKSVLEVALGCQVVLENNVKAFAQGELLYGMGKNASNLMFVKWGPGVGSAITINHQVYQGKNFRGAEIGHYIVNPEGALCGCGRRGCLETEVSTHALVEEIREALSKTEEEISVSNLESWYDFNNKTIREVFLSKLDLLALTTENVVSVLSPDHVVVYGRIFDLDNVVSSFRERCKFYDPEMPDNFVIHSKLCDKLTYIGPLATAMAFFLNHN